MAEPIYPDGIRIWEPREGAPSFIKGSVSVHPETLLNWSKQYQDAKGYIRLDLKEGRDGKLYMVLNTYKRDMEQKEAPKEEPAEDGFFGDAAPF